MSSSRQAPSAVQREEACLEPSNVASFRSRWAEP